jgi:hypothetical protein
MNNVEYFINNGYVHVPEIIPKFLCKIITSYALLKESTEFDASDDQVKGAHSVYADTLMETMLHFLQPYMEKNTGLELCPTYSYYRVYRPGMTLDKHKDRESCEISTTVCFGYNYSDLPDLRWSMYVQGRNQTEIKVIQNIGDLLIYKGCEVEHWRDPFVAPEKSYQIQGFFHYINKNGPFYPDFAFDKRPSLGWKKKI